MKTENENTVSSSKGKLTARKSLKRNKQENAPDEVSIRLKANELYNLRTEAGINGTPDDDWYQAEKYLRG